MTKITNEHKSDAPKSVRCAVITVSDTRTVETDKGGQMIVQKLGLIGFPVVHREIVRDEPEQMKPLLESLVARDDVDAILMTGGTGISDRDQTYETVTALMTKPLPGYAELFRMLSYDAIGASAILSRATGGLVGQTVLLTMPGSPNAVRLAMEKIILPELGHLVGEAHK